ncbi:MAG: hypothetical protein N2110_01260 [Flavobacteriales bacterium]|nr:hypothetical protein [Flavobacteriales bacterium]
MKGIKLFHLIFFSSVFLRVHAIDPPQAITAAFAARYSAATQVNWEKATGMYLAAFTLNGKSMKAAFKNDGTFLREEMLIAFGQLPEAVRKDAAQRFNESKITEAAKFIDAAGMTGYRIRYSNGNTRVDVMYNDQNKIFQRAIVE